jgi:crotonobetainyl-CoA:carnitine CoA-transferase CaiB-like acyl-CoA transferase
MAAPVCSALLADYGAEVLKIENPKAPDVTRSWGRGDDPAYTADPRLHATVEGGGSSFVQLNRGKKSVALNPMTPEGKEALIKLLATADIFITNVRLKSLKKAGLDFDSLASKFPKLIYGHLSAFGLDGPMVDDPGYDFGAFWAQGGLMDIVKASDDGSPPPREPGGIGDYNTGMQLLGGIFAALYDRTRTGKGQLVDASLMRAGVWSMGQPLVAYMGGNNWATGVNPDGSPNNAGPIRAPSVVGERVQFTTKCPFRLKCGTWIQLLGNDVGASMEKTRAALGVPAETLWGPDMRNIDWAAANRVADAIFSHKDLEEWAPILKEHDVWYTPVHRFEVRCTSSVCRVPALCDMECRCAFLLCLKGSRRSEIACLHPE